MELNPDDEVEARELDRVTDKLKVHDSQKLEEGVSAAIVKGVGERYDGQSKQFSTWYSYVCQRLVRTGFIDIKELATAFAALPIPSSSFHPPPEVRATRIHRGVWRGGYVHNYVHSHGGRKHCKGLVRQHFFCIFRRREVRKNVANTAPVHQ